MDVLLFEYITCPNVDSQKSTRFYPSFLWAYFCIDGQDIQQVGNPKSMLTLFIQIVIIICGACAHVMYFLYCYGGRQIGYQSWICLIVIYIGCCYIYRQSGTVIEPVLDTTCNLYPYIQPSLSYDYNPTILHLYPYLLNEGTIPSFFDDLVRTTLQILLLYHSTIPSFMMIYGRTFPRVYIGIRSIGIIFI